MNWLVIPYSQDNTIDVSVKNEKKDKGIRTPDKATKIKERS